MNLMGVVQWKTLSGQPVKAGDITMVPRSQVLIVRLPGGFYVWNRPISIRVDQHGEQEDHPIVDVTRLAQLALVSLSVVFIAWRVAIRNVRERSKANG